MSKEYIITQEELDTLEAIRLSLYTHFVTDDSIDDIINVTNVSGPLWTVINKNREPIPPLGRHIKEGVQPIDRFKIKQEFKILKRMTKKYHKYLAYFGEGGDWKMSAFMQNLNDRLTKLEKLIK